MTVSGRAIVILSVPVMEGDAEPIDWAWGELLGLTNPVVVLSQTMVDLLPSERSVSRNGSPITPLLDLAEA